MEPQTLEVSPSKPSPIQAVFNVVVQITRSEKAGYSWSYIINGEETNTITVPPDTLARIEMTIQSDIEGIRFATPALFWHEPENPVVAIPSPKPFQVAGKDITLTITDANAGQGSKGQFAYVINAVADGMLIQSPDPTIINVDPPI